MQNGAGTLEDSLVVPYKAKHSSRSCSSGSHYPLYVYLCALSPIYNYFLISATPLSEHLPHVTSALSLGTLQRIPLLLKRSWNIYRR